MRGIKNNPQRRAVLELLPGGVLASVIGTGALAGKYGETLSVTRASTKYVDTPVTGTVNLILQSQALGTTPWGIVGVTAAGPTVTNNTTDVTAPDGSNTATKCVFPATTGSNQVTAVYQNVDVLLGQTYTWSAWMRGTGAQTFYWDMDVGGAWSSGSAVQTLSLTSSWQRFTFTVTPGVGEATTFVLGSDTRTGHANEANMAAQTIYVWGVQLELGSVATGYVPTAALTRNLVAANQPAVAPQGLLVETAHTNQLQPSNGFLTSPWSNNGATLTADAAIAPDGTQTAWKVDQTVAGFFQIIPSGLGTSLPQSPSFFMKAITTSGSLTLEDAEVGPTNGKWTIDMSQVSTTTWQRITATHPAVTVVHPFVSTAGGAGGVFFPDATPIQYYLWGFQYEIGSIVHSYVPTVSGTVTEAADAITLPSTNLPIAAGSVEFEFTPLWSNVTQTNGALLLSSMDSSALHGIWLEFLGSGAIRTVTGNSSHTITDSLGITINPGQRYRIRMVWGGGNVHTYVNDALVASVTDGSAQMPDTHNTLHIGTYTSTGNEADGYISNLRFYP